MYKKFTSRAKTVEEAPVENIKDYSKNKVLYTLSKKRSPQTVVFVEDLEDPCFIHVLYYKTRSGVIADTSMIIAKDISDRLRHMKGVGWELK